MPHLGPQGHRSSAPPLRTGEHGIALKSADKWAIPLDTIWRRALHNDGDEEAFLARHGIDGRAAALALWAASPGWRSSAPTAAAATTPTARDAINAVLAGAGHNLRLLRRWLAELFALCLGFLLELLHQLTPSSMPTENRLLHA